MLSVGQPAFDAAWRWIGRLGSWQPATQADLQSEMLLPFAGAGVAMTWQLELPPAPNQFDSGSIADVLFNVEYTALADTGYRSQVVERLNADHTGASDCVLSPPLPRRLVGPAQHRRSRSGRSPSS